MSTLNLAQRTGLVLACYAVPEKVPQCLGFLLDLYLIKLPSYAIYKDVPSSDLIGIALPPKMNTASNSHVSV